MGYMRLPLTVVQVGVWGSFECPDQDTAAYD